MRVLEAEEVSAVNGGEAGVPHSDYYYGSNGADMSGSFLYWLSSFWGEWPV